MDWEMIDTCAKQWVKEAGVNIRASFDKILNVQTKSNPNDLVTNIDREVEQFFIAKIRETFPEHRILGEEGFGDDIKSSEGIIWILDPIDGTINFIHQQRNFAISLGVYEDGIGKIGLVYDVVHDELYHAVKGKGAYLNEKKLPALEDAEVSQAIICMNAVWVAENRHVNPGLLERLAKDVRGIRSYGSASLEMIFVAAGRIDAYLSRRLAPWDFGGGAVIVEELGGIVTNLNGEKLDYITKDSLLVAKPGLHRTILKDYLKAGKW